MMTHTFHVRLTILLVLLTFSSAQSLTCSDSKVFFQWFDKKKSFCSDIDKADVMCRWPNVKENCPNACGLCETTVTKPPSPSNSCIDSDSAIWTTGGNKKFCSEVDATDPVCNWPIFKENCPNACDVCNENPSEITITPTTQKTTQKCEDKEGKIPMGAEYGKKSCTWLATSNIKSLRCTFWNTVIDHCYKTCTACDSSTIGSTISPTIPPVVSPIKCEDQEGTIGMGSEYGKKTCEWLATSNMKSNRCSYWNSVFAHCYQTCTGCAGSTQTKVPTRSPTPFPTTLSPSSTPLCEDQTFLFDIDKEKTVVSCASLSQKKDFLKVCMNNKIVMTNCVKTCTSCSPPVTSIITKNPSKSSVPTSEPLCEDKTTLFDIDKKDTGVSCATLPQKKNFLRICKENKNIKAICFKTCTSCSIPVTSIVPTSAPLCEDKTTLFDIDKKNTGVSCASLPQKKDFLKTCKENKKIMSICFKTCTSCSPLIPTLSPTQKCEDQKGTIGMGPEYGKKTCEWLATSNIKSNRCSNWNSVFAHCYQTCTACAGQTISPVVSPIVNPTNAPSNAKSCKDSTLTVDFGGKFKEKDCKWFAPKPEAYITKTCTSNKTVRAKCYKTCTRCVSPTTDPPQPINLITSPPTSSPSVLQTIAPTSSPIELSMSMSLELFLL